MRQRRKLPGHAEESVWTASSSIKPLDQKRMRGVYSTLPSTPGMVLLLLLHPTAAHCTIVQCAAYRNRLELNTMSDPRISLAN